MKGKRATAVCGIGLFLIFLCLTWRLFDPELLAERIRAVFLQPGWLLFMFAAYLLSFMLKAAAWRIYVDRAQPLAPYVHGIHYSLLVNHLLPLKAGDLVRAGVLMKAARQPWDLALHSVAVMRLIDLLVLGGISVAGMLWLGLGAQISWGAAGAAAIAAVLVGGFVKRVVVRRWPFAKKHYGQLSDALWSVRGLYILGLVTASWVLEAAVLLGVAHLCGIRLDPASAVWANGVTIGGQVFQVTPGGIGTYESVLSGTLAVLGVKLEDAYIAAVLTHAFKFMTAFALGAYSLVRMPIGREEVRRWTAFRRDKAASTLNKAQGKELL